MPGLVFDNGKTWHQIKGEFNVNYEDEAKKKRTCPVYSSTYDNGGWPDRDELPTKDPIGDVDDHTKDAIRYMTAHQAGYKSPENEGDVCDPWVEGYNTWKEDQKAYELKMRPHLKS
jgi:hypothetical protein